MLGAFASPLSLSKHEISMMKKHLILTFLLTIGWITLFSQENTNELTVSNFKLIKLLTHPYPAGTQLSIALVSGDDVSYVGYKKEKDTLMFCNNQDAVFEIGSITKLFTSALLSDLVCNGALNLDDSIGSILPFKLNQSSKNEKPITYKTLSNHTAGIPRDPINYISDSYPGNPYAGFDNVLLVDYLKNLIKPAYTPGETYEYSNLGYAILGYLLEVKTKKPYEALLQEKIFKKYNMHSTSSVREKITNHIVKGQDSIGKVLSNWDFNAIGPAGGVLSNVADLSAFAKANFSNDSILSFQRQQTYQSNYAAFALGWNLFRFGGTGKPSGYFHAGGTGGYSSMLIVDTIDKLAIVVLSNVSCFHPKSSNISTLGFELLRNLYRSAITK